MHSQINVKLSKSLCYSALNFKVLITFATHFRFYEKVVRYWFLGINRPNYP
jgi:hypothetical protein